MQTLDEFIAKHGIELDTCTEVAPTEADRTGWTAGSRHWSITLHNGSGRAYSTRFHTGSAILGDPEPRDVLVCAASDSAGYENAQGFEQWADEYGYDTDSRAAERTFEAVKQQAANLRTWLGVEAYNELLWDTDNE